MREDDDTIDDYIAFTLFCYYVYACETIESLDSRLYLTRQIHGMC